MLRVLWFFLKLGLLVAAAVWLANRPGAVTFQWLGYRVETTVGIALLGVLLLAGLAAVLYRLWGWLRGTPRRVARSRAESRRTRGYRALTQGMVAIAAGDPDHAL